MQRTIEAVIALTRLINKLLFFARSLSANTGLTTQSQKSERHRLLQRLRN